MKLYTCFLVVLMSIFISFPNATFAQTPLNVSSPPILKINQYYVIFTYPSPPYIDSQNRVLVPLRSLSDLLGAKVSYNSQAKQATIILHQHTLVVTADSKDIIVDQQAKQMDTIPVEKLDALFVPLKVLIDHLQVNGTYQTATRTIELNDPKYMKYTPGLTQETWDRRNLDEDQHAFRVTSYTINLGSTDNQGNWSGSVTYTAENITDHIIAQGKEDVHAATMSLSGGNSADGYGTHRERHQAVKPGESITRTIRVIGMTLSRHPESNRDLGYVIVKPYAVK